MPDWRPADGEQPVFGHAEGTPFRVAAQSARERFGHAFQRDPRAGSESGSTDDDLAVVTDESRHHAQPGADRCIPADCERGWIEPAEAADVLRLLADELPASVCYVDSRERCRFANRTHEAWFGVSREDIIGKDLREALGTDAHDAIGPHVRTALAGRQVSVEASLGGAGGRRRAVRAQCVPRWNASRTRVEGALALISDAPAGEQPREEGTHLREAAHSARLDLMGEMAGELTHELAQPLAAIGNYSSAASFLLQQGRTDELRDVTQKLGLYARRALAIMQNLRRFLSQDTGASEPIDMHELVRDVLRFIQGEADAHGLAVRFETALSLPPVRGDRTLIEQVVLALLRQALDAARRGPAREAPIVISVGSAEGAVEVAVRNGPAAARGAGQPRDDLDPGFALCRRIVESHGGRLWAEDDREALGIELHFTLPGA